MYKKSNGLCMVENPGQFEEHFPPKRYNDLNCRERCEANFHCTGFDVYKAGESCTTWESFRIFGNGHTEYECYVKTGTCFITNYS